MNRKVIYYQGRRYTRRAWRSIENNCPVITTVVHRWDPDRSKGFLGMLLMSERVHRGAPFRLSPSNAGCYVDGHWGQYATAHMVQRAEELGYSDAEVIALADRNMDECAHGGVSTTEPLSDDEHEALICASDEVEQWLNDNVAPDGYSFGWWEGEFFLWSESQWEE